VIELVDLNFLASEVADLDLAPAAVLATTVPAVELLVGIDANNQQAFDLGGLRQSSKR
jgi:acetaldehyde dehydrogenase (acetylating)